MSVPARRATTSDRLTRLDLLASRLKADEPMTVAGLAAEIGISPRTLFRDIAILRDRGLPVEADKGRGGGIRLHRTWGIGRLSLSYREAVGLLVSLAIAERLGSPWLIADLGPVRRKLAASFSPALRDQIGALRSRILIGRLASAPVIGSLGIPDDTVATALFQSFLELRCLGFRYTDATGAGTSRMVEPHYLLLNYPVWYLIAWDRTREDIRSFRSDRITDARIADEKFRLRPMQDFKAALEGSDANPA